MIRAEGSWILIEQEIYRRTFIEPKESSNTVK